MSWKSLGLLAATLAFCTTLMAKNEPFLGVWELNLAKSSPFQGKSETLVNIPDAGGFKSIRTTVNKDNTARVEVHPYGFDGNFYPTQGSDPREIAYKRPDPNTIERTTRRNGQITVDKEEVSKDGKTLTVTQGTTIRVFEKQFNVQEIRH